MQVTKSALFGAERYGSEGISGGLAKGCFTSVRNGGIVVSSLETPDAVGSGMLAAKFDLRPALKASGGTAFKNGVPASKLYLGKTNSIGGMGGISL